MPRVLRMGRRPASRGSEVEPPSWVRADPARIDRALHRALRKPTGGWAVLDASARIRRPRRFVVAQQALVAWPSPEGVRVAPDACPHMGAPLCEGRADRRGRIVCPWHGLALGGAPPAGYEDWAPHASFDDGVLSWVRLPALLAEGEAPTARPITAPRPPRESTR